MRKPNAKKPNLDLLKEQGKLENKRLIETLYIAQDSILRVMEETDDKDILKELDQSLTKLEFALQGLWGFTLDHNMHRFWNRPKCSCPKIDNEERYGTKAGQIVNKGCILHG